VLIAINDPRIESLSSTAKVTSPFIYLFLFTFFGNYEMNIKMANRGNPIIPSIN
jgi:hypothetical protein